MKYLTFTNYGNLDLAKNLYKSFVNLNIQDKLWIVCTDKKSYDEFESINKLNYFIDGFDNNLLYGTTGFNEFMLFKLKIVKEALSHCEKLVYVDSDIYFYKDPTGLLEYVLNNYSLFMQKDSPGTSVCSGFFGMTNIPKNISLLENTIHSMSNRLGKDDWNDQNYISAELYKQKYMPYQLPMHLFPNGHYAFIDKKPLNESYIVHANYLIGIEEKIKKLKEINAYAL